jgi:hypothetical protein
LAWVAIALHFEAIEKWNATFMKKTEEREATAPVLNVDETQSWKNRLPNGRKNYGREEVANMD